LSGWRTHLATARLRLLQGRDRRRIRPEPFTIVSNDCWGPEVYQHLARPYATPFVGMFIQGPCFLRLLKDLDFYVRAPLEFVGRSRYDAVQVPRDTGEVAETPIGVLAGDVEIHFVHLPTEAEAREKWVRRVERINPERIAVKACSGKDGFTDELLREFDALPYERKVVFSDRPVAGVDSTVVLNPYVTNGALQFPYSRERFDVVRWLNGPA
jgi:uncharacterized protein (DUF1919 family)